VRLSGSTEPGCSLGAEVEGNRWLYSRLITLVGKTLPARVKGIEKRRQSGGLLFSEKKEIENIALIMS